jgi:hypothetical protein
MGAAAEFSLLAGAGCVLMWALLTTSIAQGAPRVSTFRAASVAAAFIAPMFVVVELWSLAFAAPASSPSAPWVVAGIGALGAAVVVPLMATQTPRLLPDVRRRAVINVAVLIVCCTLIGEWIVFRDAPWSGSVVTILTVGALIGTVIQRRKSRAG